MPAKGKPIEARITDWLEKQGYPLELSVANAFRQKEFGVVQGTYYEDPQEKIAREIDVIATKYVGTNSCDLQITTVIECKSSTSKPWIVFSSTKRKTERAAVSLRAASVAGRTYLSRAALDEDVRRLSVFKLGERVGYGVTQAFTSGKDVAYAALMGAAKAAADQLRDFNENYDAFDPVALIVLPVVVTDARLFECYVDAAGALQLEEATRLTISWQHPGVGRPVMFVEIVRADIVAEYVASVHDALGLLSSKDLAAAKALAAWKRKHGSDEPSAAS